jgi:hypothetical protein
MLPQPAFLYTLAHQALHCAALQAPKPVIPLQDSAPKEVIAEPRKRADGQQHEEKIARGNTELETYKHAETHFPTKRLCHDLKEHRQDLARLSQATFSEGSAVRRLFRANVIRARVAAAVRDKARGGLDHA